MFITEMYSVLFSLFIKALVNIPGINKMVITFKA